MAIPKLLDKMRHSVQDTGDDNMTGNYALEGGVLQSSNSDVEMLSNWITIADSLTEVDESNLLRLYYDVNGTTYTQGIIHEYVPQKGLQINMDAEASGDMAIIAGVADPIEDQDVATKNYVDNSGGIFWAEYGVTTYEEVINAFNSGKAIFSLYPGNESSNNTKILSLYTVPAAATTELYFMPSTASFSNQIAPTVYFTKLNSSNTWQTSNIAYNYFSQSIHRLSGTTPLNNNKRYYRPILVSTQEPTASDGDIGDIWIVYTE